MCSRAVCATCQGITYRGCGNHVEQVLAGVPQSQRCACPRGAAGAGGGAERRGLLRLFSRR
ncbi:hypothetical protein GXW82_05855 [Streptacidiphilus sp. 4-A2]|nr:hypothetical protein [Streptacidiphilus sp. 4-A2]